MRHVRVCSDQIHELVSCVYVYDIYVCSIMCVARKGVCVCVCGTCVACKGGVAGAAAAYACVL